MVIQFMAGILSKTKDNKLIKELIEVLSSEESSRRVLPTSFKCLAEYGDKHFAKNIIKEHPSKFWIDVFQSLTDVDSITVSFLLDVFSELNEEATEKHQPFTENPFVVTKLIICSSNLTQSGIRRICKSLEKEFCSVTALQLIGCHLNDECVDCMRGLVSSRLIELTLNFIHITDAVFSV